MKVIHSDRRFGLNQATACGKSLHGWANISRRTPILSTTNRHEVTCKNCIAKEGK